MGFNFGMKTMDLIKKGLINQTVHHLFELQVKAAPDAIALIFQGRPLTYHALNQQANCLANYLIATDLKKDSLVGIYFERSLEMIISLLAILKAGCGYVPLDRSYPQERLFFMMADAQLAMVITSKEQAQGLCDKIPVVTIESVLNADLEISNPEVQVDESSLMYVNYTSGSTGKPKGVAITHRSVLHLLDNPEFVNLDSNSVLLQLAPAAFDAFTFELWGALLHGGTCVLHDEKMPTINGLRHTIETHNITTAFLTTSLFNLIIDEDPTLLVSLQQILTGGEAHSIKHFCKAWNALPQTELIHVYGPTECTTFATYFKINKESLNAHSIPIGYPINKTEVYVLNEQRHPLDKESIGELYIGGPGLARGYLHAAELTQNQFISDLPWLKMGQRIYKTGDLVSMLPNGALVYMGRKDFQVKIHGFRIELEEIETALKNHPEIKQASVQVIINQQGNKKLIASLVAEGAHLERSILNAYLRARLPAYMIPSQFIWLEKMPLTANGKIDRKALQNL